MINKQAISNKAIDIIKISLLLSCFGFVTTGFCIDGKSSKIFIIVGDIKK
jgi:hypothetical protein